MKLYRFTEVIAAVFLSSHFWHSRPAGWAWFFWNGNLDAWIQQTASVGYDIPVKSKMNTVT